ncbi:MAG: N-acetyltransferase [marine bacterium B5-7]|nr:MAG: N-acetyltransferase [marine bacterium B5-7]
MSTTNIGENLIIEACSLRHPQLVNLVSRLDAELADLYPLESNHLDDIETLEAHGGCAFGAIIDHKIVGCGMFKIMHDDGTYAEIKRVYVEPESRGLGIASRIVSTLELELIQRGIALARLETGSLDAGPIALYEYAGYVRRSSYGAYREDPMSVFFEKNLS